MRNRLFWLVAIWGWGTLVPHPPDLLPQIAVGLLAIAPNSRGELSLPLPQVHPLPPSLAQWQPNNSMDNYFSQVEPTPVGYLVWSEFPVQVWIQRPENPDEDTGSTRRFRKWVEAVGSGVVEWRQYLPLEEVQSREKADIIIEYAAPPWNPTFNRETGKFDIPRARSAQTNYKFYLSEDSPPILRHRMTIQISPGMSYDSTVAAIRHEMGHALGFGVTVFRKPMHSISLKYAILYPFLFEMLIPSKRFINNPPVWDGVWNKYHDSCGGRGNCSTK